MTSLAFTPEPDGRWLEGHFPGRPVVPGVVLLEAVVTAVGWRAPFRIERVKFLQPCRPGETLTLQVDDDGEVVDARILDGDVTIASLRLRRGAVSP